MITISSSLVGTENFYIDFIMIILRQKEYSKATKLVAGLKGIKDKAGVAVSKVMTPIENAGLKAGNYVKEVVTGKPTPEVVFCEH